MLSIEVNTIVLPLTVFTLPLTLNLSSNTSPALKPFPFATVMVNSVPDAVGAATMSEKILKLPTEATVILGSGVLLDGPIRVAN